MSCVLANSLCESGQRGDSQKLPGPKTAAAESSSPHPPHTLKQTKGVPHPPCGLRSSVTLVIVVSSQAVLQLDKGVPHMWAIGSPAFRNVSFGRTPALLDCGADGLSLWDPGAASPEAGPASAARGPGVAPGHNSPTSAPSSHLLECRPLCPSECMAN